MKVRTKIIDKSIPMSPLSYAREGDAGIDLTATRRWIDEDDNVCYGTNRAFEIPKGFVGLLFPRSSNSRKDLILSNSVGVIDSCFRGEVLLKFKPSDSGTKVYCVGDRVGQLIILPYTQIEFEECDELSETERGSGGFGSTGS